MKLRIPITNLAIFLIAILVLAGTALGQEGTSKWGIKLGLVSPGEVTIEDLGSDDGDMSYSVGGFLDYQLAPRLFGGISLDLHNAKYGDESETLMDFSVALKAMVSDPAATTKIRPLLALGYGAMSAVSEDADGTKYFLVKAGTEIVMERPGSSSWLIEIALFAAPSGGNSDADVTFGPGFLLRGGLLF